LKWIKRKKEQKRKVNKEEKKKSKQKKLKKKIKYIKEKKINKRKETPLIAPHLLRRLGMLHFRFRYNSAQSIRLIGF
jgi:predicted Holliday junction resolvase-like endonuclease